MPPQMIEVKIDKDGNVTIHVQGIKGQSCTDITKTIESALGGDVEREWTAEAFDNGDDGETAGVEICQ